ncbi:class I SAM-dependent methyltransferase [Sciscionella sediminilitoris]|uniref:class I SAM-dependent methyltransferase n=1 Tax=Sciscionella sediminilitoris TaxID=1445613 RepID=UPI0004DF6CBD|nr:class I SAM-dependent methyltransferase [Sciscionella sp. SE31]
MPTLPESHEYRLVAESFGAEAERYDRTRPRYPGALIERVRAESPGAKVLDVGTGTGIVARQLERTGAEILGVEPDERMAEFARSSGVAVEVAKFEEWEPRARTFDTVVAGQTWHWVDPVAGAEKAARVLGPGGLLAVFWNAFEAEAEIGAAMAEVYRSVLPESPINRIATCGEDPYGELCTKAAEGMRHSGAFGEPQRWRFAWEKEYSTEEWLDVLPTFGSATLLLAAERAELLDRIGAVLDAAGGRFTVQYATVVVAAQRA